MNASEARPSTIVFAEEELAGKMLATVMIPLEGQKVPWPMMTEEAQTTFLNKARENMIGAVRAAVEIIATNRMPAIQVKLESVKFDGKGVEGKLTTANTEASHQLADHAGAVAFILLQDPNRFEGGTQHVTAKKDQGDLPGVGPAPDIRENKDKTFTCYLDGVPLPEGKGFKTKAEAEEFLTKRAANVQGAADAAAAPKSAPQEPPAGTTGDNDTLPFVLEVTGGYRIATGVKPPYTHVEGQPAAPFKTEADAQAWLDTRARDESGAALPEIRKLVEGGYRIYIPDRNAESGVSLFAGQPEKPFPTHEDAEEWLQAHLGVNQQAPALDDALAKFRQAGRAEYAKPEAERDLVAAFETAKHGIPEAFIEEHRTELEAALEDGYDKALNGEPEQKPEESTPPAGKAPKAGRGKKAGK